MMGTLVSSFGSALIRAFNNRDGSKQKRKSGVVSNKKSHSLGQ